MDPTLNRRGSSGGGQSSLGYLFGSESDQPPPRSPPPAAVKPAPPYGIDSTADEDKPKMNITVISNNNYQRSQGPNSGNFITDRPTTRVKSVPGGGSSLGYLFGDK